MARTLAVYKSYSFRDKDPIIDKLRTIIQDQDIDFKRVAQESGVSETTIFAWLYGVTRRPQFASLQAVFLACGYSLNPTNVNGENVVKLVRKAPVKKKA